MELHAAIALAGGLHTRAGLAKRWGVSKQYVGKVVCRPDFPSPIPVEGNAEVWLGNEADAWRNRAQRQPMRTPSPRRRAKIDRKWILDQASTPNMRSALDQYDDDVTPIVEPTMRALAIEHDYEPSDIVQIHQLALLLLRLEVDPESQ